MDKMEFESWKNNLPEEKEQLARGFFSIIKRESERVLDISISNSAFHSTSDSHDLSMTPYSDEYSSFLKKAPDLLHKAGELTSNSGLRKFLHSKADAFLSNEYHDSDIARTENRSSILLLAHMRHTKTLSLDIRPLLRHLLEYEMTKPLIRSNY